MEGHRTHGLVWAVSYVHTPANLCWAPCGLKPLLRDRMETCLRRYDIWEDNRFGSLQPNGTLETTKPKLPNKIWNVIKCKWSGDWYNEGFEEKLEKGRIWTESFEREDRSKWAEWIQGIRQRKLKGWGWSDHPPEKSRLTGGQNRKEAHCGFPGTLMSTAMKAAPLHTVLILTGLRNKIIQILSFACYRYPMYISINTKGDLFRSMG